MVDSNNLEIELFQTDVGKFWDYANSKVIKHVQSPENLELHYPCVCEKFFRVGDVCLDIGAHVGTFSIPVARLVGSEGRVFSFEPFPKTYELFQKNIELNNVSDIVQGQAIILSDKIQSFKGRPTFDNMGGTWFKEEKIISENTFSAITVDLWLSEHSDINPIDFIKIDVEGMEIKVLTGASETLGKYKPVLFIEVCEDHLKRYGFTINDLEKLLKDHGYHFFRYCKPLFSQNSGFRRLFSLSQGSKFYNLLAIHPEDQRYITEYSRMDQAFMFMLNEKIDIFWRNLRSKYRLRTRIKNLLK